MILASIHVWDFFSSEVLKGSRTDRRSRGLQLHARLAERDFHYGRLSVDHPRVL